LRYFKNAGSKNAGISVSPGIPATYFTATNDHTLILHHDIFSRFIITL